MLTETETRHDRIGNNFDLLRFGSNKLEDPFRPFRSMLGLKSSIQSFAILSGQFRSVAYSYWKFCRCFEDTSAFAVNDVAKIVQYYLRNSAYCTVYSRPILDKKTFFVDRGSQDPRHPIWVRQGV